MFEFMLGVVGVVIYLCVATATTALAAVVGLVVGGPKWAVGLCGIVAAYFFTVMTYVTVT